MAENIAGLFEQFSRIIPIAGEAMTDFGESNALFAYAEGEEGCVTLTPETAVSYTHLTLPTKLEV
mgnify:CR=1 FL=1